MSLPKRKLAKHIKEDNAGNRSQETQKTNGKVTEVRS